jgi:hypothetical protein
MSWWVASSLVHTGLEAAFHPGALGMRSNVDSSGVDLRKGPVRIGAWL